MKEFIKNLYDKNNFGKRLILVILAVITMGFALSWLVQLSFGTDPCTSLNIAVAAKIGTIANMFMVGYSVDFFSWIWGMIIPTEIFNSMIVRILILIPALGIFIFAVAVYIDVELGTAPYDAIPFIIHKYQSKFSFRLLRCIFDFGFIIAAWLLGAKIGVVTLIMGFTLGPVIAYVEKWIQPLLGVKNE
ncbi:MAG: hypothetical protein KH828_03705 [Clostridiales bacterium]|nr:hypothetical protein [Clostridiales bacterium]